MIYSYSLLRRQDFDWCFALTVFYGWAPLVLTVKFINQQIEGRSGKVSKNLILLIVIINWWKGLKVWHSYIF